MVKVKLHYSLGQKKTFENKHLDETILINILQRQSLKVMNTAYSFKASKYPVDKLVDLYSFTDRGHVITECKHCGLNVSEDKQFVNFHKGSFSSTEKVRLKNIIGVIFYAFLLQLSLLQ